MRAVPPPIFALNLPILALAFALASPARAQDADAAIAAFDEGRLSEAGPLLLEALQSGRLGAVEWSEVHRRLGTLSAARGEMERAREHFRAALVVAPDREPPPELGPDGIALYEAARRSQGPAPITLTLAEGDEVSTIVVRLQNLPDDVLAEVLLSAGAERRRVSASEASAGVTLALLDRARLVEARVHDRFGNTVAAGELQRADAVVVPDPDTIEDPDAIESPARLDPAAQEAERRRVRRRRAAIATAVVIVLGAVAAGVAVYASGRVGVEVVPVDP